MNIIRWLVRALFWLQAFAGPAILFGVIAIIVYGKTERLLIPAILLGIGVLSGILLAEFIRRKYGLEIFFARIYGPNQMDEEQPEN